MQALIRSAIENLRVGGHRLTSAREAVIGILAASQAPLTAVAVSAAMAKRQVRADRATVYRELEFLARVGVARQVHLKTRAVSYELEGRSHHHHAICVKCDLVRDIEIDKAFEAAELKLARASGFTVLRHSFELFGICKDCR